MKLMSKVNLCHLPFLIIIVFSTVQFFLILRHKNPYLSDSYFYEHIYYQMQGDNFQSAKNKIQSEVDPQTIDAVTKNIFFNDKSYKNSYSFFTKRPLYPFSAFLISSVLKNTYWNMLIPVFLSYIGLISLIYFFYFKSLKGVYAILAAGLFISFYPFLDWSTYFLTDTIAAFFWFLQILFIYKFIGQNNKHSFTLYSISLIISLFIREQSILMLPLLCVMAIICYVLKFPKNTISKLIKILTATFLIVTAYIMVSLLFKQRTIIDTIVYTQNSYGFTNYLFSPRDTLNYEINAIFVSHRAFLLDLFSHHWWFTFSLISAYGIFISFKDKGKQILPALFISSAIASYFSIFIYPVLSYRYFYPVLFSIIYFAIFSLQSFFKKY